VKKSVEDTTTDLAELPVIQGRSAGPATGLEGSFAEVLAGVVHVQRVPVDAHFFDDLGADSLVMAQFCARVRKRDDLPSVSMKDIYQHPTISRLAASLPAAPPAPLEGVLADILAGVVHVERVPVDAHFFDDLGADSLVMAQFCARVRKREDLPSVSMKDVYQHPTIHSLATALPEAALLPLEWMLAEVLAGVVHTDRVAVDSHFFDDLGADSLVMAQFCARVRKREDLPSVSMKDVYQHPTIGSLAAALPDATPLPDRHAPTPVVKPAPEPLAMPTPVGTRQYVLCGALQLLTFLGYVYLAAVLAARGYEWISAGSGLLDIYLRSIAYGGVVFAFLFAVPILAKWILIGRWKPREVRVWTLAYVRFWVVKTLVRSNPLVLLFVGSPLYSLYLRALGANIGRGVAVFAVHVPVCTDLLTIGDHTVIRKDTFVSCYRAQAGLIQTGPVSLGDDVVIGEAAVIDIGTSMGDGAQLGHRSALHAGQAVPDGERWHGSPAERTDVDFRAVASASCGRLRRFAYTVWQLMVVLMVYLPLGIGGVVLLLVEVPQLTALLASGPLAFTSWEFYRDALVVSSVLFVGALLVGLLVAVTAPRVLNLAITPDKVYPLYGLHYSLHRTIRRFTNRKFLMDLFGDSSYVVPYLRHLGYDLGRVQQTGANFGTGVLHETPYLISVGRGTMIADGLSIINAHFSSTSFSVSRASIGPRNFLGNRVVYPSQGRTGDNCLLATKVMVPIDGKTREGVGLLGSPSFEIPRSVDRDATFDHFKSKEELPGHLAAKNRHNLRTMGLLLLVRWTELIGITLIALAGADIYAHLGALAIAAASILIVVSSLAFRALVERAVTRFGSLSPQFCSMYEPYSWWHERYWKLLSYPRIFDGTAFKGLSWRLLGVQVGRRVFDDGCHIPERTLVAIGDDCSINAGTEIQSHSQEDGAFKSDRITIGAGCTLGTGAFVHYGVTMGDGVVLAADSFLMKGADIPPRERWGGNPAREMPEDPVT
jgi:non-ribosomal peptide synthetase-like protein